MRFPHALAMLFSLVLLLAVTTKSQVFPPAGSCGPEAGGQLCAPGFCCSKWGFCGNTGYYCDPGECQSQCPPVPSPPPPSPPPPSPSPPPPSPPPPSPPVYVCGPDYGGAKCSEGWCCALWGWCFELWHGICSSPEWCQSQCEAEPVCGVLAGGAKCQENQCCTRAGLCANSIGIACQPPRCQSQCPPPYAFASKLSSTIFSSSMLLKPLALSAIEPAI